MKDFKLRGSDNIIKKRANKQLIDDDLKHIKETGEVTPKEYLSVTKPKKKGDNISKVDVEMQKAKDENQLGVPDSFYELNAEEQAMLMFYLSSDFVHPVTCKHTHMNVLQSYITAFLDEDDIFSIWEKKIKKNEDGEEVLVTGKVKNYKKFANVKLEAMGMFKKNPNMQKAWTDMVKMSFGEDPKEMVRNAILTDSLYSEDNTDKNQNRKMAVDILGLKEDKEADVSINLFTDGGGKELVRATKGLTGDEFTTDEDDLEIGDD